MLNPVYIIHETTEYDKFHVDPSNRTINYGHLQRLKDAIRRKNLLAEFPIVVDADMNVMDGQHRLRAAQELGLSIFYVVSGSMRAKDVPSINAARKQWSQEDHLHHYVTKHYSDYIALDRYTRQFPEIKLSDAIPLCHQNGTEPGTWYGDILFGKKEITRLFEDGDYTCNNLPFAEAVAQVVRDFKPYFKKYHSQRQFVRAIANLVASPQYDHDRMMQKVAYLSAKLRPCVTTSDYLAMLNDIYNYKANNRDKVEFKLRETPRNKAKA